MQHSVRRRTIGPQGLKENVEGGSVMMTERGGVGGVVKHLRESLLNSDTCACLGSMIM